MANGYASCGINMHRIWLLLLSILESTCAEYVYKGINTTLQITNSNIKVLIGDQWSNLISVNNRHILNQFNKN